MNVDTIERNMLATFWAGLKGEKSATNYVDFTGNHEGLPSKYHVSSFASAAVGAATLAVAEVLKARTGRSILPRVAIDRAHAGASYLCDQLAKPVGWELDEDPEDISGNYQTSDGWLRIHAMYMHHRAAALSVLDCHSNKDDVTKKIINWNKDELEAAIIKSGGCAAALRSPLEWSQHPQGKSVQSEPLFWFDEHKAAKRRIFDVRPIEDRPLHGLRVLDLTRVLAGPIGSRFLAAYGADVVRIDPVGFYEPNALLIETTRGKRTLGLDLNAVDGASRFERLLRSCDVLIHGLRPGAMEKLGFSNQSLFDINPNLVVVRHNAYGWTGPWCERRGFDSLVQMSSGIAFDGDSKPKPLPAQALDYTTGYLIAAAACRGLLESHFETKLSLARTAAALVAFGNSGEPAMPAFQHLSAYMCKNQSDWGPIEQLNCPGIIESIKPGWDSHGVKIGRYDQIDWRF